MEILPIISLLAGIASVLSPCIIPVIPILFAYNTENRNKKEILSFILGFSLIFILLIFLTGFFTIAINYYVFYFRIIACIILFIMGLYLVLDYNFIKFNLPKLNYKKGLKFSFILGFISSIAWAPCFSAYLASLIALLASFADPLYASLNILIYSIGFGLTLFIISYLFSKINLNKLINNSNYIQKLSGILILICAIYMFLLSMGWI
ncbi:cytochrome c biogenesis CcdA family protein [Methanobrevibacter sp. DSM 116169]|uniref:cytochrome c biogenesis CcdA family protein n=1 Tax=Methanobrevibacter sp. DSM 116169 TaxID=3242727 RepID=UPI0038FC073F